MNVVSMLTKRGDRGPQALPAFAACKDVTALRDAIETLSAPFGILKQCEVQVYCRDGKHIRAPGLSRNWAICQVRLQTDAATAQFGAAYGLDRSSSEVLISPELPDDFALPATPGSLDAVDRPRPTAPPASRAAAAVRDR
jgi:hypothetical protein